MVTKVNGSNVTKYYHLFPTKLDLKEFKGRIVWKSKVRKFYKFSCPNLRKGGLSFINYYKMCFFSSFSQVLCCPQGGIFANFNILVDFKIVCVTLKS